MPGIAGRQLANLAPFKGAAGLAWENRWQRHGFAWRYEGERYADAANTHTLDAHAVLDWSSRVALTRTFTLTLNVWNLFDHAYRVYDLVEPDNSIRAAGRRFLVGAEARF